jgi:L-aminopeptidase/D-esterase-like protein
MYKPGPSNSLADIDGIRVGHASNADTKTGTTVILCTTSPAAGVDIRGGGPGLRETDVLNPENQIGRADAIVLSGGTVFGLAAADGVTTALAQQGIGLKKGRHLPTVPIVSSAILFDLTNGGNKDWGSNPPYHALGIAALKDAQENHDGVFTQGAVGAGAGAIAGIKQGGIGSTSLDLGGGVMVGALVAVNSVGSVYMPDGKTFWAQPFAIGDELGGQKANPDQEAAIDPHPKDSKKVDHGPGTNTTIGVVATSAKLTTAECKRVAMMAHDGFARAIRPVHTPFDGDTIFCISGGSVEIADGDERHYMLSQIGAAAADCMARAVARGVYLAQQKN